MLALQVDLYNARASMCGLISWSKFCTRKGKMEAQALATCLSDLWWSVSGMSPACCGLPPRSLSLPRRIWWPGWRDFSARRRNGSPLTWTAKTSQTVCRTKWWLAAYAIEWLLENWSKHHRSCGPRHVFVVSGSGTKLEDRASWLHQVFAEFNSEFGTHPPFVT